VAIGELAGPEAALRELAQPHDRLEGYHLYHAARGEMLRRLGRRDEARAADELALSLTENPAERRLLEGRIASD
jgi:predicted RNA polymerase sigma factor